MAEALASTADKHGVLLLAPSSRGHTWDVRHAPACDDTLFIDRALAHTFASAIVDAKHIALMGLSDGAAFTLSRSACLANGDFFSDVQSFSASTFHVPTTTGKPRLFVSHGRHDDIIPFSTGQRIADTLSAAGYDVMFRPFDGGHEDAEGRSGRGARPLPGLTRRPFVPREDATFRDARSGIVEARMRKLILLFVTMLAAAPSVTVGASGNAQDAHDASAQHLHGAVAEEEAEQVLRERRLRRGLHLDAFLRKPAFVHRLELEIEGRRAAVSVMAQAPTNLPIDARA